jgi:membrane protease YdiL (CAAX protease family)
LTAYQETYPVPHGGRPPEPPELPVGADPAPRWPLWYAPVGFLAGFAITLLVSVIAGVIATAAGADVEDDIPPSLVVILTLLQGVILAGTAIFLASRTRRPRPWHFGLRRARFWPSVGWAALGLGCFFLFVIVYSAIVTPEGEQSVTEDLGADESTLALIAAGFVVIVVAPVAEEFFFRGFFYRALRSRLGVLAAAAIDGVVFGLIHFTGSETLELLPILGVLGFIFCIVYERTRTLYTVIALHAFNNSIAYGVDADAAAVSLVLGPLMLAGCMLAPRLLHPPGTAARA